MRNKDHPVSRTTPWQLFYSKLSEPILSMKIKRTTRKKLQRIEKKQKNQENVNFIQNLLVFII